MTTTSKPSPCARALHGFEGQGTHELSFNAGVSILLLRRIDENWLEGKLDGKVGIFPANYVKIQLGSPSVARENALAKSGKPYAIALHSFRGGQPGDLPLVKGELIELTGSVGSDWLRGKAGDKEGIFPASFAQIIKPLKTQYASINGDSNLISSCSSSPPVNEHEKVGAYSSSSPPSHEEVDVNDDDEVYELEFGKTTNLSDSRPKPVAKPRRRVDRTRHGSAPGLKIMENGLESHDQSQESTASKEVKARDVSHDQHPTPSRSAPAPPNATGEATSNDRQFTTLPKPKPRHKLSRHASESDQIRSLESELAIEEKMLESTQNLLLASKDEIKVKKLQEAAKTHQSNLDRIQGQLEEAKTKHDALAKSSAAPPSPPSLPPRPAPPPGMTKAQRRAKVIDELIVTERDFHHQMEICSSKMLPALREISDINTETLFGNMAEVTRLSCDFLTSLEESSRNEEAVGGVFMSYSSRLREVYAGYCRNHDSAAALLEKYMDTPSTAEKIRAVLDRLRGEIQAWDLQSLLIKPVQRVLKYPLLLDKLVETTSSKHDDRVSVMNARETMGQVAQDINEVKRRKDIVERYTGPTKDDRKGTVSMHSLQKKVRRIQQSFTQMTGLRRKTVDPKFDELEQKVLSIDALLRQLLRDIGNWQEELQHVVEGREALSEGMDMYCSGAESLTNYHHLLHSLQQAVRNNGRFVKDHVTTPLETLIGLFQDPFHLIEKRKDKLLDYDHMQYTLDHTENPPDIEKFRQLQEDCTMARRNYEALNTQLLEELPNFVKTVVKMLQHLLATVVHAQYLFHSAVSKLYDPLCEGKLYDSADLQAEHAQELATVTKKLVQLSIVPASLSINFTAKSNRKVSSEGSVSPKVTNSLKLLVSPQRVGAGEMHAAAAEHKEEEDIEDEEQETEELPEGTELEVLYDFEAQDKAELSVVGGQSVTLIRPHDRIGCKEWWLVRTETAKGYVPAAYLAEYNAESS